MHTIRCHVPMQSSPSANGTVTDGPISAARTWLWPLVSALRSLCSHVVVDRRDVLHHACEVGVAARLELDRRHAARGVRDEHGADPVAEAGVGDGLLRVLGHVDRVAVAARVEREFLASCMHVSGVYEVSGRATDVGGGVDVAVPDPLVLPLIEVAADVLRELDAADVPASLRRCTASTGGACSPGPAPASSGGRCVADDAVSRARGRAVPRAPGGRGDARRRGRSSTAPDTRRGGRGRGDLALLRVGPVGGAAGRATRSGSASPSCSTRSSAQRQRETDEGKSRKQERAALEEARRRADAARLEAETAAERAEQELQKERTARRTREDDAIAAAGAAQRQVDALQTQLDQAHAEVEEQQNNATRGVATRARARRRSAEGARRHARAAGPGRERGVAARATATSARSSTRARSPGSCRCRSTRCSAGCARARRRSPSRREVVAPARAGADAPHGSAAARRRHRRLAGGSRGDARARPTSCLIVDGYNVAFRAWADATPADQRERLGIAATALCRRHGCEIVLVFDGDGSGRARRCGAAACACCSPTPAKRPTRWSCARSRTGPAAIPVVVASSDAWVREHAREQGAVVVGADALVRVIRPDS